MTAIWAAVISVVGTVLLIPLALLLKGNLVFAGRVKEQVEDATRSLRNRLTDLQKELSESKKKEREAHQEAVTWKQSYDTLKDAFDKQNDLLERQQMTSEIIDKVMVAVNTRLEQNRGVSGP